MTTKNNPAHVAFINIAKEVKAHGSRMEKLVKPLLSIEGFDVADIKGGGKYYADLADAVAQAYLTPAKYKIWADTSLATSNKGDKTERGKLMQAVSPRVAKVRDAIVKALDIQKSGGATGKRKTPTESFFAKIDAMVKQLSNDKASATFEFDPILARKHLVAMIKDLK